MRTSRSTRPKDRRPRVKPAIKPAKVTNPIIITIYNINLLPQHPTSDAIFLFLCGCCACFVFLFALFIREFGSEFYRQVGLSRTGNSSYLPFLYLFYFDNTARFNVERKQSHFIKCVSIQTNPLDFTVTASPP